MLTKINSLPLKKQDALKIKIKKHIPANRGGRRMAKLVLPFRL
jgi:hypothetical protein